MTVMMLPPNLEIALWIVGTAIVWMLVWLVLTVSDLNNRVQAWQRYTAALGVDVVRCLDALEYEDDPEPDPGDDVPIDADTKVVPFVARADRPETDASGLVKPARAV